MIDTNINFQIFCTRPDWAITNKNPRYTTVRYRIYVDNDLITERNWIWGNNIALHEQIYVKFDLSSEHRLRLEPVLNLENQAAFEIHYPRSEGRELVVVKTITPLDLLFRIA